jgi:hypothetical protein
MGDAAGGEALLAALWEEEEEEAADGGGGDGSALGAGAPLPAATHAPDAGAPWPRGTAPGRGSAARPGNREVRGRRGRGGGGAPRARRTALCAPLRGLGAGQRDSWGPRLPPRRALSTLLRPARTRPPRRRSGRRCRCGAAGAAAASRRPQASCPARAAPVAPAAARCRPSPPPRAPAAAAAAALPAPDRPRAPSAPGRAWPTRRRCSGCSRRQPGGARPSTQRGCAPTRAAGWWPASRTA